MTRTTRTTGQPTVPPTETPKRKGRPLTRAAVPRPAPAQTPPALPAAIPGQKISGIYQVRFTEDDRVYVGASANISRRWTQHLTQLREGTHRHAALQAAYHRNGPDGVRFELLESGVRPADLGRREDHWIRTLSAKNGFNRRASTLRPGSGNRTPRGSGTGPPCEHPVLTPRFNQLDADAELASSLAMGESGGMVQAPCGSGKSKLAAYASRRFQRVLVITHTNDLVDQMIGAFQSVWPGHDIGLIKAKEFTLGERFTVACLPSLIRRLRYLKPDAFDLIIHDEAHLAGSPGGVQVVNHFRGAYQLGMSATPERESGPPLETLIGRMIYSLPYAVAQRRGILVPVYGESAELSEHGHGRLRIDKKTRDYDELSVADAYDTAEINAAVAKTVATRIGQRVTVVFAVNIVHARHLADALREEGVNAEAIWGTDPDRVSKTARFMAGTLQVLVNVQVVSYGFDAPHASCAVLTYPSRLDRKVAQMVGRVVRTSPGKDDALVIDTAGNFKNGRTIERAWNMKVDLPAADEWGLITPKIQPTDAMLPPAEQTGRAYTVTTAPVDLFGSGRPARPLKPTEKQLALLARWNVPTDGLSRHEASVLISRQPATDRQLWKLHSLGFDTSRVWGKMEASRVISDVLARTSTPGTLSVSLPVMDDARRAQPAQQPVQTPIHAPTARTAQHALH